jgi:hypothetical protein
MIALKLRGARQRAAAKREDYIEGRVPFGFRSIKKDGVPVRVPEPAEQATIVRALELRASGLRLTAIAMALTAEGRKPRAGTKWHPQQVARIVDRAQAEQ